MKFKQIKIARLGGYKYSVRLIVSVARCTNRSQTYKATLANGDGSDLPGEFASVSKAAKAIYKNAYLPPQLLSIG